MIWSASCATSSAAQATKPAMTGTTAHPRAVLVLGGGSDIGLTIAHALVARGARCVILAARRPESLDAPAAALRALGAAVEVIAFDAEQIATHEAAVAHAFDRARALGADIDVAVLAFGLIDERPVLDESPEAAGRVAIVNFAGAVSSGLAVAQQLSAHGHGTIVVLSSLAGQRARPSILAYASAKAGLDAFADGLDEALHDRGVRVMTVRPGWVQTKMIAGRRSAPFATTPARVAADVMQGLDRGARVVWTPGVMRYVAGVIRFLPRRLFRFAARWR